MRIFLLGDSFTDNIFNEAIYNLEFIDTLSY
jgi:hypothetical protein